MRIRNPFSIATQYKNTLLYKQIISTTKNSIHPSFAWKGRNKLKVFQRGCFMVPHFTTVIISWIEVNGTYPYDINISLLLLSFVYEDYRRGSLRFGFQFLIIDSCVLTTSDDKQEVKWTPESSLQRVCVCVNSQILAMNIYPRSLYRAMSAFSTQVTKISLRTLILSSLSIFMHWYNC